MRASVFHGVFSNVAFLISPKKTVSQLLPHRTTQSRASQAACVN